MSLCQKEMYDIIKEVVIIDKHLNKAHSKAYPIPSRSVA